MSSLLARPRFHHAAVVVSDLDRSVDFYRALFGGEIDLRLDDVDDVGIAELHGLERARFDLVYIRYGSARVELFQFHEPGPGEPRLPAANEIGSSHLAFEVEDVAAAYTRLSEAGVSFSRPPLRIEDGEAEGIELAFLADPDGNRIELLSHPHPPGPRPAKVVVVTIEPESRETFLELAGRVLDETEVEAGAEQYSLHEEDGKPGTFWIYERYADEAALSQHHGQPALKVLLGSIGPLLREPPQMVDLTTHSTIMR